tara:strand:+ start:291 stop:893 length:603 start_codon:yes stop_codon:yes gene_type:complete
MGSFVDFAARIDMEMLLTAATCATVVRLSSYLLGSHDGTYLRESISKMGITVVVLEVLIVMTRFFTTFQLLRLLNSFSWVARLTATRGWPAAFVVFGVVVTYLFTTLPGLLLPTGEMSKVKNDAIVYLRRRPFELLPVLTEYVVLYVLSTRSKRRLIIEGGSVAWLMCMSLILLIIAIRDVPARVVPDSYSTNEFHAAGS